MGSRLGVLKAHAARLGLTLEEYTARVEGGQKWCTSCKSWQPRDRFGRDSTRSDGLSAKCFGCTQVKVRAVTKGRPSTFKGRTHTPEARALMSQKRKGRPGPWKGKRLPSEIRKKIAEVTRLRTARGEQHYAYSHGKHQRDRSERRTVEYQQWRNAVFARDGYACQHCGDARGGNLQAHHLKPFASHPHLRYDVANGVTLCRDCHEKVHLKPIPPKKCRRKKHSAMPPAD